MYEILTNNGVKVSTGHRSLEDASRTLAATEEMYVRSGFEVVGRFDGHVRLRKADGREVVLAITLTA